ARRFERVVMKCLAKRPDDRYRDAAQLLGDLNEVDGAPTRWWRWWSSGCADQPLDHADEAGDDGRYPLPSPFPGRSHFQVRRRRSSQLGFVLLGKRSLPDSHGEARAVRRQLELEIGRAHV